MGQIVSAKAAGIAGNSAYSPSNGLTPVCSNKKRGLYPSGIGPEMVSGPNIHNTLQLWPQELLKPHIRQNRKVFEINDAVGVQLSG